MPLTLILLLSCQGDTGNITLGTTTDSRSRDSPADTEPAPPRTLRFADVGYPASEEERRVPRASRSWEGSPASRLGRCSSGRTTG